jgi:ribonuclease Y
METLIPLAILSIALGGIVGYLGNTLWTSKGTGKARVTASEIISESEASSTRIVTDAKNEASKLTSQSENELREHRQQLLRQEKRLHNREENVEGRATNLEKREHGVAARETEIGEDESRITAIKVEQEEKLEQISGLSTPDARDMVMREAEADMEYDVARRLRDMEVIAKSEADDTARRIITLAMHRLAADVVSEQSVSVVPLPNDEMKGRLIGREGRNIRALEAATGVDLIIDDTPEAVTISCFDPIRREIARLTLTKLVKDGRIHPARIEDTVEKAKEELEETLWQAGQDAILEAGVKGLNPEIIKLLGRLKLRYSYGENVLQHAVEVSLLSGMLAAEIGADIQIAKAGGLLHDIGKALTHEVDGPHAEIGGEVARRYGISDPVRRAVEEHHDDEMGSIEAFLVATADAMSAARPGVRKDTLERYVQRLEALESVAQSFEGVEKVFAIQAGREVRIMVQPTMVDDIRANKLALDIVKQIEQDLQYPGQIKVTVIRETRSTEYAR